MDLSSLSNEELMAIAGVSSAPTTRQPRGLRNNNPLNLEATVNWTGMQGNDGRFAVFPDLETGVAAADRNLQTYANKHGLNTVSGVINRWAPPSENDSRAYAQTVAQKLGVGPDDPLDMSDPQVRRAMLDAMADVENGQNVDLGAAMPEQQAQDLTGFSDEELMRIAGIEPPKAPAAPPKKPQTVARSANGGVTVEALGEDPTIAQDAWSGLTQPFRDLRRTISAGVRQQTERAMAGPPSLMEAAKQTGADLVNTAGLAGQVLGLTSAPLQAIIRPVARGVNRYAPTMYETPGLKASLQGQAPRALNPQERQAAIEGVINTALSAAQPPKPRPMRPTVAKPQSLEEVKAASDAAWDAVDASGYRFSKSDLDALSADVNRILSEAGPELYPNAQAMVRRIDDLAMRGELSPAQANRLRSQIGEKLLAPGSTEVSVGGAIKGRLDEMIDGAGDPNLARARDLYARQKKMEEVVKRVESADIQADTNLSGAGQSLSRQKKLKPLIDPKSPQRIRNLTPEEARALSGVVRGTPGSNATRYAGQILKNRFLQGVVTVPTFGVAPVAMDVAGTLALKASEASQAKRLQNLLDLMSVGGTKPTPVPPPTVSYTGPLPTVGPTSGSGLVPILSARGITGVGVTAAPLTRVPSSRSESQSGKKERTSPPRKRKRTE